MKGPWQIYEKVRTLPFGDWLYMRLLCFKIPYFGTIRPYIVEFRRGKCAIGMKKRSKVLNHLKTVHAIAMCNMCELTAGLCLESVLPCEFRWIAKSMEIHYLGKGQSDLTAVSSLDGIKWHDRLDLPVPVDIKDKQGQSVAKATVFMYVSQRPAGT